MDSANVEMQLALGCRLGVGGSCDVFEVVDSFGLPPAVLKLLRRRAAVTDMALGRAALQQELVALRDMQSDASEHLPHLLRSCVTRDIPCLLLSPAGIPLAEYLCSQVPPAGRPSAAELATRHTLEALLYAHRAGWLHNDLRTCNVVAVTAADGAAVRFVLVDWGMAQRVCADGNWRTDVGGYAPCACDNALKSTARNGEPWVASRATDIECTAYLCATALEGSPSGLPPWVRPETQEVVAETKPAMRFLQARREWLSKQPAASLPKKVLQLAAALQRCGIAAPVEPRDYHLNTNT
jgi:serine/threonine protein kinase